MEQIATILVIATIVFFSLVGIIVTALRIFYWWMNKKDNKYFKN